MRTALTLFIAGVTFVRFFGGIVMTAIGWFFIPMGVLTMILGIFHYRSVKSYLGRIEAQYSNVEIKPPTESR